LADAKVSKTFGRKPVGVRFPLPARYILMGGASQQAAEGGTSSEGIGALRRVGRKHEAPGDQRAADLPCLDRLAQQESLPVGEPLLKLCLELAGVRITVGT
jgi:hypothetical protein